MSLCDIELGIEVEPKVTSRYVESLTRAINTIDPEMKSVMRDVAEVWVECFNVHGVDYLSRIAPKLDRLFQNSQNSTYKFNWNFWGGKIASILGESYGSGSLAALEIAHWLIDKEAVSSHHALVGKLRYLVENAPDSEHLKTRYYDGIIGRLNK